ncbi:folate-sensitive fragile site protein Fra10Ac1-domain-containing protein [Cerioporus squamosus]|nr:folate-sensitive fragile site protein Fra10Ac1-domain-containing protein [Cerioporus squamosus]
MDLYTPYSSKGATTSRGSGTTEFEILKSSHKFLREDTEEEEAKLSWDDKLAKKYYSSLYREYAVCDLKHYKSGNFALRWRTESEVLSGAGETTCGNTRCPLHNEFPEDGADVRPALTTLELPFSYEEHGESKFALVKVVLCSKCCKKLMWKRNKEKKELGKHEEERGVGAAEDASIADTGPSERRKRRRSPEVEGSRDSEEQARGEDSRRRVSSHEDKRSRRLRSRSQSPRRRKDEHR